MTDYQSYSCANLLQYFDSYYEHDTIPLNYAQYLLSMQDAHSLKKLIHIYNKVLWKLIVFTNGNVKEELISDTWYNIDHIYSETADYWKELNSFLNENIKRLFDSNDYTDKIAIKFFVNLREAPNRNSIQEYIISKSSANVSSMKDKLSSSLTIIEDAPKQISPYEIGTNGYRKQTSIYIDSIKYLTSQGFIKSIKDKAFESKTEISYLTTQKVCLYVFDFLAIVGIFILAVIYLPKIIFGILALIAILKMTIK